MRSTVKKLPAAGEYWYISLIERFAARMSAKFERGVSVTAAKLNPFLSDIICRDSAAEEFAAKAQINKKAVKPVIKTFVINGNIISENIFDESDQKLWFDFDFVLIDFI